MANATGDDFCHPSACDRVRSLMNQKAGLLPKPRRFPPSLHIKQIGDLTEWAPASLAVDPRDPYAPSTLEAGYDSAISTNAMAYSR